jgi:hypothetical protein
MSIPVLVQTEHILKELGITDLYGGISPKSKLFRLINNRGELIYEVPYLNYGSMNPNSENVAYGGKFIKAFLVKNLDAIRDLMAYKNEAFETKPAHKNEWDNLIDWIK